MNKSKGYRYIVIGVLVALATLLLVSLSGCTMTDVKRHWNPNSTYEVKYYSGGKVVEQYTTNNFQSEEKTDGYYFIAKEDGAMHMLSGNVSMKEIK